METFSVLSAREMPVGKTTAPVVAIPEGSRRVRVRWDGQQMTDPKLRCSVVLDLSLDGGTTWASERPGKATGAFPVRATMIGGSRERAGKSHPDSAVAAPLPRELGKSAVLRVSVDMQGVAVTTEFTGEFTDGTPPVAPTETHQSVTVDATSEGTKGEWVADISWNHTTGSLTNGIIVVSACTYYTYPAEVTYDAGALSNTINSTAAGAYNQDYSSLWWKVAPASGTKEIVITGESNEYIMGGAVTASNVDQSTPFHSGSPVTATGTKATGYAPGTAATVNVTSASGELVVDAASGVTQYAGWELTVGSGQTAYLVDSDSANSAGCGSYEAGAASVTMSWSYDYGVVWCIVAAAIKEAGAAAAVVKELSLLGVGKAA